MDSLQTFRRDLSGDILVFVFLTRGDQIAVRCADNAIVNVKYITDMFNNRNSAGFRDKPKVFLFLTDSRESIIDNTVSDEARKLRSIDKTYLFACSFKSSYQANLCCDSLCEIFREHADEEDIKDMMTKVVANVVDHGVHVDEHFEGYREEIYLNR
ncbi:hypothetical protein B4U79_16801 [Dinothrombium tinctorium]|uniref:Caspase family p20 domain-containing protein n=1 Tax=Dinothrombium tinctorium TaxID=1965070 RepID=A0A3S4QAH3_9ACAR|nr:hypothetical protein B4U79_16801 [Dinothrombium tinctorium]